MANQAFQRAQGWTGADADGIPGRATREQQLVRRGFGRYCALGPSTSWGEQGRLNVAAFPRAQGWRRGDADGYPGPQAWQLPFDCRVTSMNSAL
nr:peptidoglycan-binding protein [Streptomyces showdoensis]